MKKKKISVCLATYNGENFIKDQVTSILCQLGIDDELIISDDSSSDRTVDILNSLSDPRILILQEQKFRNPILNFENALKSASGDVIFLSDQDDLWTNNKVEVMIRALNQFDLVVSDCKIIKEDDQLIHESFFFINKSKKGLINNLIKNSYLGCCMAFNKNILDLALPFPKNLPMHDWWIGMVGEAFFKTTFLPNKLIYYRRHGNNASSTAEKSKNSLIVKLSFRIKLIWELIKRL